MSGLIHASKVKKSCGTSSAWKGIMTLVSWPLKYKEASTVCPDGGDTGGGGIGGGAGASKASFSSSVSHMT